MKKSKKIYAWKNKWKRKKSFNWSKVDVIDKFYRDSKWCGNDVHSARRFQEKQAIKKLLNGKEDIEFPYKTARPSKWAFLWW